MSSFDKIEIGTVIRYPYLWYREAQNYESEGRKQRPAAVGVRLKREHGDIILLFPITTKMPTKERFSAEIPEMEKRRAGLDPLVRSWIIMDEYNQDTIGASFYLEPEPPLGQFSKAFFLPLMHKFIEKRDKAKRISRN